MREFKILILPFICLSFSNFSFEKNSLHKTEFIYQISKPHFDFEPVTDSVVLVGESPLFHRLEIFRGKNKILDYSEMTLEIIGNPLNFLVEYDNGKGEYFYIIRLLNAPEPDKFLIVKTTKLEAKIFGITEPNSAEIFGDVDYDGKFEIGGLTQWCPGADPTCMPENFYKVFEIDDHFPLDTALTKYFKKFLKKEVIRNSTH